MEFENMRNANLLVAVQDCGGLPHDYTAYFWNLRLKYVVIACVAR
jgi:hypothetical protein